MSDLSPAAQAVMDACTDAPIQINWATKLAAAAALRAAVNQVVPPSLEAEFYNRNPSLTLQKAVEIRSALLAISAELEGAQ